MSTWKKQGAEWLGFSSFTQLANVAGISSGTLSHIYKGQRGVSEENSRKLITAIQDQQCKEGWNHKRAAAELAAVINFSRHQYSAETKTTVKTISESEIQVWFQYYCTWTLSKQGDPSERLKIALLSDNTEDTLTEILRRMRSWKMKHDFDLSDRVQQSFRDNRAILVATVRSAMAENGLYELVRDTYREYLYTAHLCGECEFIKDVSEWLVEQAALEGDICTQVKAKVTLAWLLSNERTQETLQRAQEYLEEVWSIVNRTEFLRHLPSDDMDVVAMLAEIHLRIPIRLSEAGLASLREVDFNNMVKDSNALLDRTRQFPIVHPRLQKRYRIPIRYQHGIYFYRIGNYKEALSSFKSIIDPVEMLGWIRLEQAIYTWMATIHKALSDDESFRDVMSKIDNEYFVKRQKIKQELSS